MARYEHQLVWPPFKGKAHKVVDTTTGKSVGLYRTPTGAARRIKALTKLPVNPYGADDPGKRRAFEAGVLDASRGVAKATLSGPGYQQAYDAAYDAVPTP